MRASPSIISASIAATVLAAALVAVSVASASTSAVRAKLTTSSPTPVVDAPWRWTVVVKDARGKPLEARLRLQILFGGLVVGCWKGTAMTQCSGANAGTWIAFRGKRSGVLTWPAQSLGVKLTFQAVVRAGTKTVKLRAPVTVQPKA
jgi:hypothetical protein